MDSPNESAGTPVNAPRQLLDLPPEMLQAIFCSLTDLNSIKNLCLANSAFLEVYRGNKAVILRSLVLQLYDSIDLDLKIPFLACRSRKLGVNSSKHLESVEAFLNKHSEREPLSNDEFKSLTLRDCKYLHRLYRDAEFLSQDLYEKKLHTYRYAKNTYRYPLSQQEYYAIIKAMCRWDLWSGLFARRGTLYKVTQNPAAEIDEDTQKRLYLGRYSHWEREQLGCICSYAFDRYGDITNNGNCWTTRLTSHTTSPRCLDMLVSQGPRLLAEVLRNPSTLTTKYSACQGYEPSFRAIVDHFGYREPMPTDPPPADDFVAEDAPYGFLWARSNLTDPSFPTLRYASRHLWCLGYALCDERRLISWEFEIGGIRKYVDTLDGGIERRSSFLAHLAGIH